MVLLFKSCVFLQWYTPLPTLWSNILCGGSFHLFRLPEKAENGFGGAFDPWGLLVIPAPGRVFDIAWLTKQPGNKFRIHTLCHLVTVTLSRGIMCEQSHGYVRVALYEEVSVLDYEELLSSRALTRMLTLPFPLHSSTSSRADINKYLPNLNYLHTVCCSA